MLIPTKHENLEKNILVIGANILTLVKKRAYNIEDLFQELKIINVVDVKRNNVLSLEEYYDSLTFLWTAELIKISNYTILPNKYVSA